MSKDVVVMLFPFQPDNKVMGIHLCHGHFDSVTTLLDHHLHTEKYCGGLLLVESNHNENIVKCTACGLRMVSPLGYEEFDRLWAKHTLQCLAPAQQGELFHVKRPSTIRLEGDIFSGEAYEWTHWAKTGHRVVVPALLVTNLNELTPSVYRLLSEFQQILWRRSTSIRGALDREIEQLEGAHAWILH